MTRYLPHTAAIGVICMGNMHKVQLGGISPSLSPREDPQKTSSLVLPQLEGPSKPHGSLPKEIFLHRLCGLPEAHLDAALGIGFFNAVISCGYVQGEEAGGCAGVTLDHVIVAKVRPRAISASVLFSIHLTRLDDDYYSYYRY